MINICVYYRQGWDTKICDADNNMKKKTRKKNLKHLNRIKVTRTKIKHSQLYESVIIWALLYFIPNSYHIFLIFLHIICIRGFSVSPLMYNVLYNVQNAECISSACGTISISCRDNANSHSPPHKHTHHTHVAFAQSHTFEAYWLCARIQNASSITCRIREYVVNVCR